MTLKAQVEQIKNHINDKTQHPYLDQFIIKPVIDDDKITFLLSMFRANGHYKNISRYVTAIMIMQMALDMHDTVSIEKVSKAKSRERQLTVLAGDYYSSQYYCMMSEMQDFPMIRCLSEGIRRLNEEKVGLFRGKWQWDGFLEQLKRIETSLIMELANFLDLSHWLPAMTAYFAHNRLRSEKQALHNGEGSIFMEPLFHKFPEKRMQFLQQCDGWLLELKEQVDSEIKSGVFNDYDLEKTMPIQSGDKLNLDPNNWVGEGFK